MAKSRAAEISELRLTADELRDLNSTTQGELKRLQGEAQALRQNWQSTSGKSFDQTMADWNRDAAAMQNALGEIENMMRKTATTYENREHDNAQLTSSQDQSTRTYTI